MTETTTEHPQDTRDGMARNTVTLAAFTMVSRVTGLGREMLFASLLGASPASDAYAVAIQIPNGLRQLLAEGAMAAAFVPMMSEAAKESRARVWLFVRRFLWTLVLLVALLLALSLLAAPLVAYLFASSWRHDPERFQLAVTLIRITFPYILLVSLSALLGSVLNYFGSFGIPALAPALFNTVVILVAYALSRSLLPPVLAFAVAWLIAGSIQVLVQVPFARDLGMSLRPEVGMSDPLVRMSAALLVPRLMGYGVNLINSIVAVQAATWIGAVDGKDYPSHLYYAMRITEFVLGGFVTSLATVLLPTLSRQASSDDRASYLATVNGALRAVAFVTIPAATGLAVLRTPVVSAIFERHRFDAAATADTAYPLAMYCTGLFAFGAIRVLVPAFYADRDTWTPFRAALLTVSLYGALLLCLAGPLRQGGIALALALASYVYVALLLHLLRRRHGPIGLSRLLSSFLRIGASTAVMGATLWLLLRALPDPGHGELHRIAHLALLIGVGVFVYFGAGYALRCRELWEVRDMMRVRLLGRTA